MTRRPRRNRPPLLDDLQSARPVDDQPRVRTPATPRRALVTAHVAGPHPHLGRAELEQCVTRLTRGDAELCFGLDLGPIAREEPLEALAEIWGWSAGEARAAIDPTRTLAAFDAAASRIAEVAAAGGRIALATGRPASLLPLFRAIAASAAGRGAQLLACDRYGPVDPAGRWLWWHDGVAVVTDGASLAPDDGIAVGPEWLFAVGRPDLAIADHGYAGTAVAAGIETLAFADLDAVAFGVAELRHLPVQVVPVHDGAPPAAYAPLAARIEAQQGIERIAEA
jgi:hypothetical protein